MVLPFVTNSPARHLQAPKPYGTFCRNFELKKKHFKRTKTVPTITSRGSNNSGSAFCMTHSAAQQSPPSPKASRFRCSSITSSFFFSFTHPLVRLNFHTNPSPLDLGPGTLATLPRRSAMGSSHIELLLRSLFGGDAFLEPYEIFTTLATLSRCASARVAGAIKTSSSSPSSVA